MCLQRQGQEGWEIGSIAEQWLKKTGEGLEDGFIGDNNNLIMFDRQKMQQLQQRSHVRGMLSKEFYQNEQAEVQRKRREMRSELDRQVEERRRLKEQEKVEQERKMRREQEGIKNYYKQLDSRQKKTSLNESNMKNTNLPYQTYPIDSNHDSHARGGLQRNHGGSKPKIVFDSDIPLLPVMLPLNMDPSSLQEGQLISSNLKGVSHGVMPLLDLQEEQNAFVGGKSKKGKNSKREKTLEGGQMQSQAEKGSRVDKLQLNKGNDRFASNNDRRSTLPDEESILGSLVRANNSLQKKGEGESSLKEIQEVEFENNSLRMELKKNQEAVSLLMGAMKSNVKLDKFRAQAEKILSSGSNLQSSLVVKKEEEKREEGLMLPRINLKHQSIMYDYLLSAARRGKRSVGK